MLFVVSTSNSITLYTPAILQQHRGVGAGTTLSQSWFAVAQKDMQFHWDHHMHSTEWTDYHKTAYLANSATAYPTVQLSIPIFRQGKTIQNNVLTTVYHDIVTTSYPLLCLEHYHIYIALAFLLLEAFFSFFFKPSMFAFSTFA